MDLYPFKLVNKLEGSACLANKKTLFTNMKSYYEAIGVDPYLTLPTTFHITNQSTLAAFKLYHKNAGQADQGSLWIVKPGENANRGHGIQVANSYESIEKIVKLNQND